MSDFSIHNTIRQMLADEFGLEEDLAFDQALFSSGLLDSLNSLEILVYLEKKFGLKISPLDVALDDFDTVNSIVGVVERLRG